MDELCPHCAAELWDTIAGELLRNPEGFTAILDCPECGGAVHVNVEMRHRVRSKEAENADNLVTIDERCPYCMERDADKLIWNDFVDYVICNSCGGQYVP